MRAEARGESGTLTAWTPAAASSLAPASSFAQSNPRGGTISTSVTNSPRSSRRAILERERNGGGSTAPSTSMGLGVKPTSTDRAADSAVFCAATARSDARMARMCAGVVPQQPPMTCTPARRNLRA